MKTKAPRRQIIFSILVLAFGAGWIGFSATPLGSTTGGVIPAPRQGFAAPDFNLSTPQGETIYLSDLRGQPVLVNIWASWCGPCRAEMPAMQRVYDRYKDQGFVVLAVNATNQDNLQAALDFSQQLGLTFPILLDAEGKVSQAYQMRALPSSYFIDRQGIIQEVVIGGPMAEALLLVRVEQLLEEVP